MMMGFVRRRRRAISGLLLLLNVTGARAITVLDPGQRSRDFYGPSLAFRGVVAKVMHQDFKSSAQHALGEKRRRFSTHELELTAARAVLAEVILLPPGVAAVTPSAARAPRGLAWKLPAELCPTKPPHLHSKK